MPAEAAALPGCGFAVPGAVLTAAEEEAFFLRRDEYCRILSFCLRSSTGWETYVRGQVTLNIVPSPNMLLTSIAP